MNIAIPALIVTQKQERYNGEVRGGSIVVAGHSIPIERITELSVILGTAIGSVKLDDGTELPIQFGGLFASNNAFSGSVEIYVQSLSKVVTISAKDIHIYTRKGAESAG